jgi:serine/threonine-protein kinase
MSIIVGVLHGLHAIHEAKSESGEPLNIVHRDISPQNILVGSDGTARVLDFGIAKAVGRLHTTRDGALKGKLSYMPPEQFAGVPVTRQADIYAASVVLWEALTQRRLFLHENEAATLKRIMDGAVDPPSKTAACSPATDGIVLRGLSTDLSVRYATAREMALALEREVEVASASEVAAWVDHNAHDALRQRQAIISEIEQGYRAPPARRRRSSKWPFILLTTLLMVAIAAGLTAAIVTYTFQKQRTPTIASAPAKADTPPPLQAGSQTATSTAVATTTAERANVAQAPPATRAPVQTHPTRAPTIAPPTNACDPPYTIDANNHRHYKPNCFP